MALPKLLENCGRPAGFGSYCYLLHLDIYQFVLCMCFSRYIYYILRILTKYSIHSLALPIGDGLILSTLLEQSFINHFREITWITRLGSSQAHASIYTLELIRKIFAYFISFQCSFSFVSLLAPHVEYKKALHCTRFLDDNDLFSFRLWSIFTLTAVVSLQLSTSMFLFDSYKYHIIRIWLPGTRDSS